ncbi:MAG: hypothetical protein JST16_08060 [Bdellovibrionales bacterium]|nr:hypothetical protein [Bdellovibrionales bacterium]
MKIFGIFVLMLGHCGAFASAPKCELRLVNKESREFEADCAELPGIKIPLYEATPEIRVLELREVPGHADLALLVYEAGVIGTKVLYRAEQAVVIHRKQKKVLGQERWRFEALKPEADTLQPEWKWGDREVSITLPNTGRIKKISW